MADTPVARLRCEGRYPVSGPRSEPFDVTYRCGRMLGHAGLHGADDDISDRPEPIAEASTDSVQPIVARFREQIEALIEQWRDAAVWEFDDMSNTQAAQTFDQCADDLARLAAGGGAPVSPAEVSIEEAIDYWRTKFREAEERAAQAEEKYAAAVAQLRDVGIVPYLDRMKELALRAEKAEARVAQLEPYVQHKKSCDRWLCRNCGHGEWLHDHAEDCDGVTCLHQDKYFAAKSECTCGLAALVLARGR